MFLGQRILRCFLFNVWCSEDSTAHIWECCSDQGPESSGMPQALSAPPPHHVEGHCCRPRLGCEQTSHWDIKPGRSYATRGDTGGGGALRHLQQAPNQRVTRQIPRRCSKGVSLGENHTALARAPSVLWGLGTREHLPREHSVAVHPRLLLVS